MAAPLELLQIPAHDVYLEAECAERRVPKFVDEYWAVTGVYLRPYIDFQVQKDKYGLEGRIYFNSSPDQVAAVRRAGFTVQGPRSRGYLSDKYKYRIDHNDVFWELIRAGHRLRTQPRPIVRLKLSNFGPIRSANLTFGDLTIVVGPQASGKSLALQTLKLVSDIGFIQGQLGRYGLDWDGDAADFADVYFGEGMRSLWNSRQSTLIFNGREISFQKLAARKPAESPETVFYIPAQRVLTLREGWPRPFADYSAGDPFVVRNFSERIRAFVEQEFAVGSNVFPDVRWMQQEIQSQVQANVFANMRLRVDKQRFQKRLVLETGETSLPFMVWSAGQREFVPLLMGLYMLRQQRDQIARTAIDWVILEELEMGLHPRGIGLLLLMVFDLLARGYRVCLATHSPQVLEAAWALRALRANGVPASAVNSVFNLNVSSSMFQVANAALTKSICIHYFNSATGQTKDISNLDVDSEEAGEGGWGGLTEFSGRVNAAVARSVSNANGS